MPVLREALDAEARAVGVLGDLDRAVRQVRGQRARRRGAATLAAAGVAVLAVWAAAVVGTDQTAPPVGPSPSAPAWPAEVSVPARPNPLASHPLRAGADLALIVTNHTDSQPSVVAVSGQEVRLVASARGAHSPALSPDGRWLAFADVGYDGDHLQVYDLREGRSVVDEPIVSGGGRDGQSPRLEWSADGRRLYQVVLDTGSIDTGGSPRLRTWVRDDSGHLVVTGPDVALPGTFLGADASGRSLAVDSDGGLLLSEDGRAWAPDEAWNATAVPPSVIDARLSDPHLGSHLRSPDGSRLGWVGSLRWAAQPGEEPQPTSTGGQAAWSVGWLDLTTGAWTTYEIPHAQLGSWVGWYGDEPLILLQGVNGQADLVVAGGREPSDIRVLSSISDSSVLGPPELQVDVARDRLP